jgi:hypothetical protein
VLESDLYRRLAYSWHTFTPELAEALQLTDEARERIATEQPSKVTFEIEPLGDLVKLTVVHDGSSPAVSSPRWSARAGRASSPASRPCSRPE